MDQFYKYYLKRADNYYRVENGIVHLDSYKKELEHATIEWANSEITFERNAKYWGVFIENSLPLQFTLDGAKILRHIVYTDGFEADCSLYIEKLNTSSTLYEFYYQGTINFYTKSDERDQFSVQILDKGVSGILKSRESTPVEVPLTTANTVRAKLDGVLLRSNALFIPGQGTADDPVTNVLLGSSVVENLNIIYSGQQKAATSFISPKTQEYAAGGTAGVFNYKGWLFRANTNLEDVNFKGLIQAYTNVDDATDDDYDYFIQVVVRRSGVIILTENMFVSTGNPIDVEVYHEINLDHTLSIPLQTNDLVYILSAFGSIGMATAKETKYLNDRSILYVSYLAKVNPTNCRVISYLDMMNHILSNISDGQYNLVSDFLTSDQTDPVSRFINWDSAPKWIRLASGDALRGLPNPVIKSSFFDPFKDLYSHYCVGLGIEGNSARIEPLKYFLGDDIIATIYDTGNVIVSPLTDKIFNQINIGYENYDNNNVAGKNEYNTGLTFIPSEAKNAPKNEDDCISPLRFDQYGAESARAETLNANEQDNRADNDIFGFELDPIPQSDVDGIYYKVYRPAGVITGVDDPVNSYNVTRTGGRAVRRHLPRIRSIVKRGKLTFQTTDKNPDLVSTFGAGTVVETEDINLESDTYNSHDVSRLFQPHVFEFEFTPTPGLYNAALANPRGCIEFDFYGTMMKGYILQLSLMLATGKSKCKLLGHRLNDETKLIR